MGGMGTEHASTLLRRVLHVWPLPLTLVGLLVGIVAELSGQRDIAWFAWTAPAVLVGIRLAWQIMRDLLAREAGVDVIALLAIVGAILVGEPLAAIIIAVMLATGEALEEYAQGRAHRELTSLLERAPQQVHRYVGSELETVPVASVRVGDLLLVRPGEVVPVDGVVVDQSAVLDESALTGESRPVTRQPGEPVASGVIDSGGPFQLRATATAEASTYAGIVRLVEHASRSKAPAVRLADRYGLLFVPLALGIAGAAWLATGDPERALAVLVVATPCPLILAVPIAIVSGISRAARRGIIVKGGGPLETVARARVMLFDKTGTLTAGRPRLVSVAGPADPDEVLGAAASLEQASPHVLASAIVAAARGRELPLRMPTDVDESPGAGVTGRVDGRWVRVGTARYALAGGTARGSATALGSAVSPALPRWVRDLERRSTVDGTSMVYVAIDGELAGALVLDDPIRPETPRAVRSLRRAGYTRIVMVTGDRAAVADLVASAIGLDGVLADRHPEDKVEAVRHEASLDAGPVVMVGDGINDAPALAAADVGIAMGARGATSASEAADIVITVDRLDRLPEAVRIARRSRSIALQGVFVGMGLSIVAMVVAAFGAIPVIAGALLQEVIDITVILNALRALRGGDVTPITMPGWTATHAELVAAHQQLAGGIDRLRTTADGLGTLPPTEALGELRSIDAFLTDDLLPHEEEEDRTVHPDLARAMGTDEATLALHGTHTEIFRLTRVFHDLVEMLPSDGPDADDLPELRRVLYGLHAILRLHQAQEEELYASVTDPVPSRTPATAV